MSRAPSTGAIASVIVALVVGLVLGLAIGEGDVASGPTASTTPPTPSTTTTATTLPPDTPWPAAGAVGAPRGRRRLAVSLPVFSG